MSGRRPKVTFRVWRGTNVEGGSMAKKRVRKKQPAKRPARAPSRRRLEIGLVAVLAGTALFFVHAYFCTFTMDDTLISLRYAKNFVEGRGLVFNPGERVEGYSNFSWTMLLALFLKLGLSPIAVSRWLGVAFAAGAVFLAARMARALEGRWGWMSASVAVLAAGNTALAYWSTSGMETGLFLFLITAAFERGVTPGVSSAGRRAAPLLFALATLTRPDAPLFFFLWLGLRAYSTATDRGPLRDPARWRGIARDGIVFLAPLVPYVIWKPAYFTQGIDYAWDYLRAYGGWGLLPVLSLLALTDPERRGYLAPLVIPITAYAGYVVVIGGDVLPIFRFWLTILPLGCVLLAAGTFRVTHVFATRFRWRLARADRIGFALLLVVTAVGFARNHEWIQKRRQIDLQALDRVTRMALWMKERLEPGEAIASTANGALPYFSERPFIDMLGLTDREIARTPQYVEHLDDTWKEKKYNAPSVLRRRPAFIMFSTGIRPSSVAEKSLFLFEDFRRNYYIHEFRVRPETPWTNVVYRLRPDAPPPPQEWVPTEQRDFLESYSDGMIAQGRDRDMATAAELFARTVDQAPPDFIAAREWAATMRYDTGDTTVVPQLRRLVAEDSLALRATSRLAHHHAMRGEFDEAEELFRRFARMNPDLPDGWEGMADIRRIQGEYAEARSYVVRSLERWNTNPISLIIFARLCIHQEDLAGAEAAYRRVLLIDPELEEARQGIAAIQQAREGGGR
jgi:tetratricopeptide (TPR) repeat protein